MTRPRLFAVPLGAPYPAAFAEGFLARCGDLAPEEIARITIYANSRPMASAIGEALAARGPALLPRLRTITDLALERAASHLPAPADPLALRLELTRLTRELLTRDPTIAPRDAAFDIAGSLLALLGEMAGEGVPAARLHDLDLAGHSTHWQRSLAFIDLVAGYLDHRGGAPEAEAHLRAAALAVTESWAATPPSDPVVIAGSTGSRGTTRLLMEAAARGGFGYVVLPGFDPVLPENVWKSLGEGHPQYRYRALLDALALGPGDVEIWAGRTADPDRARVLSLALRPPPVTDQWIAEGAKLPELNDALERVSLIEAPSDRIEAVAIALGLRDAVERGQRAALVTPDRVLTRRVTAALTRWGIEPDDSAGRPLALSAPGRLLRQVAALQTEAPGADAMLALVKHPLVASGSGRGAHLLHSRELELWLRRTGRPFAGGETLLAWAGTNEARKGWAGWLSALITPSHPAPDVLEDWLDLVCARAEALAAGPEAGTPEELWKGEPGEKAREAVGDLVRAAPSAGHGTSRDFQRVLDTVLQGEVRNPVVPHGDLLIRGTIEARALDADFVILAGLNDGVWPPAPDPDPWLNRSLRKEGGLLSPERRTGLSAHDFEQAFSAPEIWLSRTLRGNEGETVPSRWLNRLTGLVSGLEGRGGVAALENMRGRGARWVAMAESLDRRLATVEPAPRPAPCPPVAHRPHRLSVTEIEKLVRDPYAIYARHVLGLRALPAPLRGPDPRLRGTVLHRVVERLVREGTTGDLATDHARLLAIADEVFADLVPWPVTRTLWRARLDRIVPDFLAGEYDRRRDGTPAALETSGTYALADPAFTLTGKADRIDRRSDGLAIYDYKSGGLPTAKQIRFFDRQLHLEAVMVEAGGFADVGRARVSEVAHIGLGSKAEVKRYSADDPGEDGLDTETVSAELRRLVAAYLSPNQGFAARRAMTSTSYDGDYDHLARYGEWDETVAPSPEDLS